jgi:hypothetical protein
MHWLKQGGPATYGFCLGNPVPYYAEHVDQAAVAASLSVIER